MSESSVSQPRIAVIILNWNGLAYTRDAVASVIAQTEPGALCVVADNGSDPGEVAALRRLADETGVLLVENGVNLGFSGGNNRGAAAAREADADYLLFLNNDATLAPDAIERLRSVLKDSSIGAASPCIYHARGERGVWFGGGKTHLDHPTLITLIPTRPTPGTDETAPTDWVCGCAVLVSTELFFAIGGFDESLFAYHEDVDLSLKVRAAGKRCVVVPEASAWHVGGGGTVGMSPRQLYYVTRNGVTVARRYGTVAEWTVFTRRHHVRVRLLAFALLLRSASGDVTRAAALLLGLADGRTGVGGSFEERTAAFEGCVAKCRRMAGNMHWMTRLLPPRFRQDLEARLNGALGLPTATENPHGKIGGERAEPYGAAPRVRP
jgi:GT2 family glycosyltransferase